MKTIIIWAVASILWGILAKISKNNIAYLIFGINVGILIVFVVIEVMGIEHFIFYVKC